jgi:crotonobetainyl-CoA:carnitine CoA-transferase CaiB-like acyl-CoA transferase
VRKSEFYREARRDLPGPLAGVRVVEATTTWAGPMCGCLLADFGADVIKVEHPGGEVARRLPPALPGTRPALSAMQATVNRNKRSVCLDLREPRGRDLFLRLASTADLVVENFRPGTLERYGLGYRDLRAMNEDVILVSISGFGQFGRHAERPGYDPLAQAASGFLSLNGSPDGEPVKAPTFLGDDLGGLHAALAALAALRHRDRTGEGQHVDVAMLDAVVAMTDIVANLWSMGVHGPVEQEITAIVDTFAAGDGWFVLQCVRPQHFTALAEVIGRPEWNDDPRFATSAGWIDNTDEVRAAIESWARPLTRFEAAAALSAAGLAAGPCLTPPEVIADPHVRARDMLVEVPRSDDPEGRQGPVLVPGNPIKMSKVAEGPETRVPWLGEHTDEVLAGELGLGEDDLAALRADGVIA